MNCSVAGALEIVGEWWTFLVLRDAFLGVRRFEDFQRRLGIARNVLTARLQTLVGHYILERRQYQVRPERYEYRLTDRERFEDLILVTLMQRGDKWAGRCCETLPPWNSFTRAAGSPACPGRVRPLRRARPRPRHAARYRPRLERRRGTGPPCPPRIPPEPVI